MTVCQRINSSGGSATAIRADLAHHQDRVDFVRQCLESGPVTALVNNAGADLLTTELRNATYSKKLDALLSTDLSGTVELSKCFADHLRSVPNASILNIGWDQADRGMEGDSGELFAIAKNAIMGFTRSLACSLAPTVRVNCIAPGWIKTSWGEQASDYWQQRVLSETPLKRWGLPQDIANMARFLLSPDASYITGQVININGGAVR